MSVEILHPWELPHTLISDPAELASLVASGVMDPESAEHYQNKHDHFVEVLHHRGDELVSARLSGNLRNNKAGDWQALVMGGDVNNSYTGTATASGATSLTATGTPWSSNQWAHHSVYTGPNSSGAGSNVIGQVLSNTSSVLTVDQWYTPGNGPSGSAGTTPNSTATFIIGSNAFGLRVLALSTDSGAPATTDTSLTGELSTNGLGRAFGVFAHSAVSGGTSSTVTTVYTLANTFTASGTTSSIQKCALFYSIVAATGTAFFENTFSSVNVISGDTLAVTWTINA